MPLLNRKPFVKNKPPDGLKPEDKIFYCELTGEVFIDYDDFWERMVILNSLVWTCEFTGKPNLTYQEALDSEAKAKKTTSNLSLDLKKPLLYMSTLTRRRRIGDMTEDVYTSIKDRYFVGEEVEAIVGKHWYDCKVTKVVMPTKEQILEYEREMAESDDDDEVKPVNGVKDDDEIMVVHDGTPKKKSDVTVVDPLYLSPEEKDEYPPYGAVLYEVVEIEPFDYKECKRHIVNWTQIRRMKGAISRDKCKMFLKQSVSLGPQGHLVISEPVKKQFKLNEMSYCDIFVGKPIKFEHDVIKAPIFKSAFSKKPEKIEKKEPTPKIEKVKKKKDKDIKTNKQENIIESFKKAHPVSNGHALQEINVVPQKSKEEIRLERERIKEKQREEWRLRLEAQRAEKKKKKDIEKEETRLMALVKSEWNNPVDDLLCCTKDTTPKSTPIDCRIPSEHFGDFLSLLQFMSAFFDILEVKEVYPQGITFDMLEHALIEREVAGVYNDLLQLLLGAIFNLQEEEEEEITEDTSKTESLNVEGHLESKSHSAAVKLANEAATWILQNHNVSLQKAHLDALTLTELIRVHLLASGATNVSNAYWRYTNRGGYQSSDDPGFIFKLEEPEILKKMSSQTVFDLNMGEKLKLLNALSAQVLTYASVRDNIDENIDKLKEVHNDKRTFIFSESRKEREEQLLKRQKLKEEKLKAIEKKLMEKQKKLDSMNINGENKNDENKVNGDHKPDEEKQQQKDDEEVKETEEEIRIREEKEQLKKEKRKLELQRKISQFNTKIMELEGKVCQLPLGEDRTHKRYWHFPFLPALLVENYDVYKGPCLKKVVHCSQKRPENNEAILKLIKSQAKKNVEEFQQTKDDKNSSDKENDVSTPPKEPSTPSTMPTNISSKDNSPALEKKSREDMDDEFITSVLENLEDSDPATIGLCTADPSTCTVHVEEEKSQWYYVSSKEEFEALLNNLNERGERESDLKQNLLDNKEAILNSIESCPVYKLDSSQQPKVPLVDRNRRSDKSNKLGNANLNFPTETPVEIIFEMTLRDMVLEFEEKLLLGYLGSLKSIDRESFRKCIESQEPIRPSLNNLDIAGKNRILHLRQSYGAEKKEDYTNDLGELDTYVKQLRVAVLLLGQAVESRYLKGPLSESEKALKKRMKFEKRLEKLNKKDVEESSSEDDEEVDKKKITTVADHNLRTPLERWEKSLMNSTSYSQLFLHLSTLENSVAWSCSVLKASCSKCRKKSDPENMLLCDQCNKGYHIYCLQPKLDSIPNGDWFCEKCKKKEKPKSPKKQNRKMYKDISDDEIEDELQAEQEVEEESEEEGNEEYCSACEMGGELILCDTCPRSFHLECADLRKVPRGNWSCPLCKEEQENKSKRKSKRSTEPAKPKKRGVKRPREEEAEEENPNYHPTSIEELLTELSNLEEATSFKLPLSKTDYPDYHESIKKPIDLRTIRRRFNSGKYTTDSEFIADVLLIVQNAKQYFDEDSDQYQDSIKMCDYFNKKCEQYNLANQSSQKPAKRRK